MPQETWNFWRERNKYCTRNCHATCCSMSHAWAFACFDVTNTAVHTNPRSIGADAIKRWILSFFLSFCSHQRVGFLSFVLCSLAPPPAKNGVTNVGIKSVSNARMLRILKAAKESGERISSISPEERESCRLGWYPVCLMEWCWGLACVVMLLMLDAGWWFRAMWSNERCCGGYVTRMRRTSWKRWDEMRMMLHCKLDYDV